MKKQCFYSTALLLSLLLLLSFSKTSARSTPTKQGKLISLQLLPSYIFSEKLKSLTLFAGQEEMKVNQVTSADSLVESMNVCYYFPTSSSYLNYVSQFLFLGFELISSS
jgi:hypothetical protein